MTVSAPISGFVLPVSLPNLRNSTRRREFDEYDDEVRRDVVRGWLFDGQSHRSLDKNVIGLNPKVTRGYQSMGILHFLGLKREFGGVFRGEDVGTAIEIMKNDGQDFSAIIDLLSYKN